ncbi:hypothetical protein T265_15774, partial [Opisthorchis viverrini]
CFGIKSNSFCLLWDCHCSAHKITEQVSSATTAPLCLACDSKKSVIFRPAEVHADRKTSEQSNRPQQLTSQWTRMIGAEQELSPQEFIKVLAETTNGFITYSTEALPGYLHLSRLINLSLP